MVDDVMILDMIDSSVPEGSFAGFCHDMDHVPSNMPFINPQFATWLLTAETG